MACGCMMQFKSGNSCWERQRCSLVELKDPVLLHLVYSHEANDWGPSPRTVALAVMRSCGRHSTAGERWALSPLPL